MYIMNLKLNICSAISLLIIALIYYLLEIELVFYYLTLTLILSLLISYTFYKEYRQKIKDNYFKKNFSDSQFMPISGIYKNLDLDKVRVSWKKLEDSYWSTPYFLNFLVKLDDYQIENIIDKLKPGQIQIIESFDPELDFGRPIPSWELKLRITKGKARIYTEKPLYPPINALIDLGIVNKLNGTTNYMLTKLGEEIRKMITPRTEESIMTSGPIGIFKEIVFRNFILS